MVRESQIEGSTICDWSYLSHQMVGDEGEDKDEPDVVRDKRSEVKKDTSHARDLLEGPSINHTSEISGCV